MAQTQTVTNEGIAELVLLWHGTAAGKLAHIVGLTDSTTCTAAAASTYAAPADAKCTDAGLTIIDIGTIALATSNVVGDSIDFDHIFTATAEKNVSGILVSNEENDVSYLECCFNAVLAMETDDTLTIDGRVCIAQAA